MGRWFRFFVGTPQRFVATTITVALVTVIVKPGLLGFAVNRLLVEVSPLVGPLVQLAILIFAFRIIFRGFFGNGRK